MKLTLPRLIFILTLFSMISQMFFSAGTIEGKIIRGIPFLLSPLIFILSLHMIKGTSVDRFSSFFLIISLFILIFGILTGLIVGSLLYKFYPIYFISDMLEILWIVVCIWVFSRVSPEFWYKGCIYLFLAFAMISIMLSFRNILFLEYPGAPHPIVMASIISTLIYLSLKNSKKSILFRYFTIVILILMFGSYLLGGGRTNLVSVFGTFSVGFLLIMSSNIRGFKVKKTKYLFKWIVIVLLLFSVIGIIPSEKLDKSRAYNTFSSINNVLEDESLERILNEATVATFSRPILVTIAGSGHGGVYDGVSKLDLPRTATPEGYRHPIHMGPAMLFFRYSILGITFFVLLFILSIKGFFYLRDFIAKFAKLEYKSQSKLYVGLLSYLTLISMLIKFLMGNIIILPIFGVSIGVLLSIMRYSKIKD